MYEYEDYGPTQEEEDMVAGMESTDAKFDWKNLKVEVDMENFAAGIIHEVRRTLKDEIVKELKESFMKELKDDIMEHIKDISLELVKDVYDNEKVIVGGWGEDKKEYTVRQYILMKVQNTFKDGVFTFGKKDRWGDREETKVYLQDYIDSELNFSKFEKEINSQVDKIRRDINKRISDTFDASTRQMLSDNVLKVLMANDTYKKIQDNIAGIADKTQASSSEDDDNDPDF